MDDEREEWIFDPGTEPAFKDAILPTELGGGRYSDSLQHYHDGLYYLALRDDGWISATWDGASEVTFLKDSWNNTDGSNAHAVFQDLDGNVIFFAEHESGVKVYQYDGQNIEELDRELHGSLIHLRTSEVIELNGKLHVSAGKSGESKRMMVYADGVLSPASGSEVGPGLRGVTNDRERWVIYNGKLYFQATDESNVITTWSFDGSNYASTGFRGYDLTVLKDHLYFTGAGLGISGDGLWKWDGENDPVRVQIHPDPEKWSAPRYLAVLGDSLFFGAKDDKAVTFTELYEYKGEGDPIKHTVNNQQTGAAIADLTVFKDKLYFSGTLMFNQNSNRQLFMYDAQNGVQHIPTWTNFRPTDFTVAGDLIYFSGYDNGVLQKIWSHSGIAAQTPKFFARGPGRAISLGDEVVATNNFSELFWVEDGTTQILENFRASSSVVLEDRIFFTWEGFLEDGSNTGRELWFSDGRSPPQLVADLNTAPQGVSVLNVYENPFSQEDSGLILKGTAVADVLVSSPNNDQMDGNGGLDRFVFFLNWGMDVINDFEDGSDLIDLSQSGLAYEALTIEESGNDTVIDDGSENTITLKNVSASDIDEEDFLFETE